MWCLVALVVGAAFGQGNWNKITGIKGGYVKKIMVDAGGNLYALTDAPRLYASIDNGANWTPISHSPEDLRDAVLVGSQFVGIGSNGVYVYDLTSGSWSTQSAGALVGYDRIFSLSSDVFLVSSPYNSAVYSTKTKGIAKLDGLAFNEVLVANGYVYGSNTSITLLNGIVMRTPLQTTLSNYQVGNWENVFQNSKAVYNIEATSDRLFMTYQGDNGAVKMAFANLATPKVWTDVTMPFSSLAFAYPRDVQLSSSPAGKIVLSILGEETGGMFVGKLFALTPQSLTWDSSWKYPATSLGNVKLPAGLVWKNGQEIYAGTDGMGVFRSIDGGTVWSLRNGTNNAGISDLVSGRFYKVGTGRILFVSNQPSKSYYYSDDQGSTWSLYTPNLGVSGLAFVSFCSLSNSGLAANATTSANFYGDKILYTSDGLNWSVKNNSLSAVKLIEVNGKLVAFDLLGRKKYSTDFGATWTDASVPSVPDSYPWHIAAIDDYVFEGILLNDTTYFYRINTASPSWSAKLVKKVKRASSGLASVGGKIYIGDFNSFYVSDNAGDSFKSVPFAHQNLVPVYDGDGGIALIKESTLTITQDDGLTFSNIPTPDGQAVGFLRTNDGLSLVSSASAPAMKSQQPLIQPQSALPDQIRSDWVRLETGINGGFVKQLFKVGNAVYATSKYNLYRYDEVGKKWNALYRSPLEIDVTYDNNDGRFFIGTGFQLTKFSETTSTVENITNTGGAVYRNAFGLFIPTSGSVYKSTDNGITASTVLTVDILYSFAEGNGILYATVRQNGVNRILVSTDGGINWSQSGAAINTSFTGPVFFKVVNAGDGEVYVTTENEMYRCKDGVNWTKVSPTGLPTGPYANFWVFKSPTNKIFLSAASNSGNRYLGQSSDGGSTWTLIRTDILATAITWLDTQMLIGTSTGGVLVSTDDAKTTTIFSGNQGFYGYNNSTFDWINKNLILINDQSFIRSSDLGSSWISQASNLKGFVFNDEIVKTEGIQFYRSTDLGTTWTPIAANSGVFYQFIKSSSNEYFALRGTPDIKLAYSKTLESWTNVSTNLDGATLSLATAMRSSKGYLYLLINGKVYRGKFDVANMSVEFLALPGLALDQLVLRNDVLYGFSSSGSIFTSTDGAAWTTQSCPPGDAFFVTDLDYMFITSTGGLSFLSRDQGQTWQRMSFGFTTKPLNIVLDRESGYGFMALASDFVFRSSKILVGDNKQPPALTSTTPANRAADVSQDYKLVLTFGESVTPVAGKQIQIFDQSNLSTPVEAIPVTSGVRDGYTYTYSPAVARGSSKSYFVLIDAGSFTDLYQVSYGGISTVFQWAYSMTDISPPTLAHSPVNLLAGSLAKIQVNVTDDNLLPPDKTRIFYRGVAKVSSEAFSPGSMIALNGAGTNEATFEASLPGTAYDAMGLEYYFETLDAKGNKTRSPQAANTYFYSYIEYPAPNQPKINQALSFGGEGGNYRLVSFPYKFTDSTTSVVLKTLQPYEKTKWRLFKYSGGKDFEENPEKLQRGLGYWMNVRNAADVLLEGAKNPTNNRTSFFRLSLQPGWNLIGNPYPTPISWEQARAGVANVGRVKVFDGGEFSNGDELAAHVGGFVFLDGSTAVEVRVPFKNVSGSGRIGQQAREVTANDWTLPIAVHVGSSVNRIGGIGMNVNARDGKDAWDDLNPPSMFEYGRMEAADMPNWSVAFNMVTPRDEFTWDFFARTNSSEPVTLTWDLGELSKLGKEFFLLDVTRQVLVDMATVNAYTFAPKQVAEFQVYYGVDLRNKVKPTQVTMVAGPNPAAETIQVDFTLPEGSNSWSTKFEIFDLLGRREDWIVEDGLVAGFYHRQVSVDRLEPGLHIIRFTANGTSCSQKLLIKR